ncbi:citrate synthase [Holdemanella biformis]|uniref:citrate synthase n=1 Tax=Holdemanella biformis TaxID=1735 RepID=UPI0026DB9D8E|nr:citrate synthase [Holdemanella biformis]
MHTLKEIYQDNEERNFIDPSLYSRYRVKAGLRNDNGTGVKVGLTKICDVIGYKIIHEKKYNIDGQLIYRGYPINYLVNKQPSDKICGFEETAYLLIFGTLPNADQLKTFKDYLLNFKMGPVDLQYETPNILNALQIEVLKLYAKDPSADTDDLEERMMKGLKILASIPLFTFSYARNKVFKSYPYPDRSLAENILCMARGNDQYTFEEAKIMDTLLMVHADHGGGNNSTFANVVISSTGTDIYSCISAAIGSYCKVTNMFKAIFHEVGFTTDQTTLKKIANRILDKDFFDHSGLIYGIGHAIYTKSDPRALLIHEQCEALAKSKGQEEIYNCIHAFEKVAIEVMKERKGIEVCANVDYYSGYVYSLLGIEADLFTPLFAISRTAGWVSHHLENRQSNRKLIRPANVYVGEMEEIK